MYPNIYRDFEDGAILTALGYDIVIQRRTIGTLALPTGRLVACDPLTHPETDPFTVSLQPGEYAVKLVIAGLRDESRIAYAVIEVGAEPATRWEQAVCVDEDSSIWSQDVHGFPVVSSVGAYIDLSAATRYVEYSELVAFDEDEVDRSLNAQLRRARGGNYSWACVEHEALGRGTLVAFTAGFGEGFYKTYIGRAEQGEITRIVTDFEVLELRFPSFTF